MISDGKIRSVKVRKYDTDSVNKARKAIYELGKPIGGVHVQRLLKATSAVPTLVSPRRTDMYNLLVLITTTIIFQNAFMDKLGPNFDLSRMLVVDFLHEFELGVWKALFVHLIRILYAAAPSGNLVAILDKRYDLRLRLSADSHIHEVRFREIPQFNQTIRRFTNNVSDMKKLAARDFEDILQVGLSS
jgi:hypothetical protein